MMRNKHICCAVVHNVAARSLTVMHKIHLSSRTLLHCGGCNRSPVAPSLSPASSDDRSAPQLFGFIKHVDRFL
ncbi:hypothetical protein TNCV_3522951 [Trichonephila clavipes]|uniref:Uncharacterized protein n=1 Tax=Trichonephila clavipes TaxID=2585209 RepID=A0A8X6W8W8_TRICX|nr:hypothetical protein TNCV_3522951 [Trichonephila clavipes]